MIHALIWLPLLALFFVLTWAGWNEFQKLQAYGDWARNYQNSKYDILAVLGRKDDRLVWGKPTRKGPVGLRDLPLQSVRRVSLNIDGKTVDPGGSLPNRAKSIALHLELTDDSQAFIPFTEIPLAAQWCKLLQQKAAT